MKSVFDKAILSPNFSVLFVQWLFNGFKQMSSVLKPASVHKFNTNKQKFIKWINTEEEKKKIPANDQHAYTARSHRAPNTAL